VESHLADLIVWLEPRALSLALLLPPLIRVVGHWVPEEIFMVAMGALAAASASPTAAITLLAAVLVSHLATDQLVYLGGRWLRPRLDRFPRITAHLKIVSGALESHPVAVLGLVPARVLPLGRGAWLAGCGVTRIPWPVFFAVDLLALVIHVAVWCGLGWWMAGDLDNLAASAESGATAATRLAAVVLVVAATAVGWRNRSFWQPATIHVIRSAGRQLTVFSGREPRSSEVGLQPPAESPQPTGLPTLQ
jgi:membrane protein DedA with SNARE-associated domain